MGSKRLSFAGLEIRLTDAVILGGLGFLLLLGTVFNRRLDRPAAFIGTNLLYIVLYVGTLLILRRLRPKGLRFLLRTGSVQLMYLQIFLAGRNLQLLFFTWNDDRVLAWEKAVFGLQPLVWIQKLYSPPLTEWMFFVYVVYIVIYPILSAVIYFRRGEEANEDYLFELGLINLVCGLGFILFPVAGPLRLEKRASPSDRAPPGWPLRLGSRVYPSARSCGRRNDPESSLRRGHGHVVHVQEIHALGFLASRTGHPVAIHLHGLLPVPLSLRLGHRDRRRRGRPPRRAVHCEGLEPGDRFKDWGRFVSRVLITGANGFIGSNLCLWFRDRGWEVDALVRESSDLHFLEGHDVRIIKGDLRFAEQIDVPDGTTHVIDAAALVSDFAGDENARKTSSTWPEFRPQASGLRRSPAAVRLHLDSPDARVRPPRYLGGQARQVCGIHALRAP